MGLTIKDLLNSLITEEEVKEKILKNTKENWNRIWNNDKFTELGLNSSELEDFLKDWTADNDYDDAL